MDCQYSIVNQCIQLLKHSDIPPVKKLRVEIRLIRMKRLMLNDNLPVAIEQGPCSEEALHVMLNAIGKVCSNEYNSELLSEVVGSMDSLLTELDTAGIAGR